MTRSLSLASIVILAASLSAFGQSVADSADLMFADESVEVSLGDPKIKEAVAAEIGVSRSDLPLTVRVEPELAAVVCPVSKNVLTEQSDIPLSRTCAAKEFDPALAEAVRDQID